MPRSFSVNWVVVLPRLTAASAERLLGEFPRDGECERPIAGYSCHGETRARANARGASRRAGRGSGGGDAEPSPEILAADRAEENAFAALSEWLHAFSRLPWDRHPEAIDANRALAETFPTGPVFVTLRPADTWFEAEKRLRLIESNHATTIETLGGAAFLEEIRAAHKAHGAVLNMHLEEEAIEPPRLREAREAALDAIRAYILRVSATVRKIDAESGSVARRLLSPIASYRSVVPRRIEEARHRRVSAGVLTYR